MVSGLILEKTFKGSGSRLIKEFPYALQKAFQSRIAKYAIHRLKDLKTGGFEHAFYYGEQRTKSFITAALDEVCDSNFIQEYSIERKVERKVHKSEKHSKNNNGRVDYLCQYGLNSVVDILIEVKQNWIRYYENREFTNYKGTTDLHQAAVKQLRIIDRKMEFTNKSLFGVAITVLPIFMRYPSKNSAAVKVTKSIIDKIAKSAMIKAKAHGYGYFILPKSISVIDEVVYEKKTHENFPGVVIIYSISKYHRK
jgi:hypothetical protein